MEYSTLLSLIVFTVGFHNFADAKVDLTKCNQEYSCLRYPSGCTSLSSCIAVATYKVNESNNEVEFQLTSKKNWVALGQKRLRQGGSRMAKLRGQYCVDAGSSIVLGNFNTNQLSAPGEPKWVSSVPEVTIIKTKKYHDSAVYCQFKRPINTQTSNNNLYSLDKPHLFVLAVGNKADANLHPSYHGFGKYASAIVDTASTNRTKYHHHEIENVFQGLNL